MSDRDKEIAALREDVARMNTGIERLLLEIGNLAERLDRVLGQESAPDEHMQVGLDAVRQEIAAAASQVQGHQELMENYYRALQRDFKAAMVKFVNQVTGINAETGELVASLHGENRALRNLIERLATQLGLRESLAVVRQVQFADGAGHGTG